MRVGLPAFVLVKVLAPAFFARGDTAMPVQVGLASVALNLALNLALMVPLAHVGPALATSLVRLGNVGCLAVVLMRRGHMRRGPRLLRRCRGMAAVGRRWWRCCGGCGVCLLRGRGRAAALAGLAALVGGGMLAYAVAAHAGRI